MSYCSQCGQFLTQETQFCGNCGTQVSASEPEPSWSAPVSEDDAPESAAGHSKAFKRAAAQLQDKERALRNAYGSGLSSAIEPISATDSPADSPASSSADSPHIVPPAFSPSPQRTYGKRNSPHPDSYVQSMPTSNGMLVGIVLSLLCCQPLALILILSHKCNWSMEVKSTLGIALGILCVPLIISLLISCVSMIGGFIPYLP
ncbi:MAG: hypothetical protein ACOX88_05755 [Christensenellales bacterium]|jgi:hypothetical protein